MYIPKHFEQNNIEELSELIGEYPLATLVTYSDNGGLEANHIPFYLHKSGKNDVLRGHIAKGNKLWKTVTENASVLAIFNGPDSYISPSLYPSKKENGRAVPTWNYAAVHVKGNIAYIHDDKWKMGMITTMTEQHESGRTEPWSVADAPEEYTSKMLKAIVGIEITIASVQGKWKVSQNQPEENKQGIVTELSQNAESNKMAQMIEQSMLKP